MNPGIGKKKNLIKEELATLPTHYAGKIIVLNPSAPKQQLRPLPPQHEPSLGRHLRLVYRLIDIPRRVSLHPHLPRLIPLFLCDACFPIQGETMAGCEGNCY